MRSLMLVAVTSLGLTPFTHATALKVANDTDYSWRVSVDGDDWIQIDPQGDCKCFQSARCPDQPGDIHNVGWVDIKKGVKNASYEVVFEYYGSGRWHQAFTIRMQGNYRTNVAQLLDDSGRAFYKLWWEPNHKENGGIPCRDKPPLTPCRETSCLRAH